MPVAKQTLLTVYAAVVLIVDNACLAFGAYASRALQTSHMSQMMRSTMQQLMQATTQLVVQATKQRVRQATRQHVTQPIRQQVS